MCLFLTWESYDAALFLCVFLLMCAVNCSTLIKSDHPDGVAPGSHVTNPNAFVTLWQMGSHKWDSVMHLCFGSLSKVFRAVHMSFELLTIYTKKNVFLILSGEINYEAVFLLPLRMGVCVCVCLHFKTKILLSARSPQTAWCNKILICLWITLVLVCAEMHREWLVYSTHNTLDKLQHCFSSEVEREWLCVCLWVRVHACVWAIRIQGQSCHTPFVGLWLEFILAHFDIDWFLCICPLPNCRSKTFNLSMAYVSIVFLSLMHQQLSCCLTKNLSLPAWSETVLESFKTLSWTFVVSTWQPLIMKPLSPSLLGGSYCFVWN